MSPATLHDHKRVDREVGLRVCARRKALRISQTALGEAIGVSFQQVQKYERGANRISASALVAIASALSVPAWTLLSDVGHEDAPPPIAWALSLQGGRVFDAMHQLPPHALDALVNTAHAMTRAVAERAGR